MKWRSPHAVWNVFYIEVKTVKRKHDIDSLMLTVLYGEATDAEKQELEEILAEDSARKREYHELRQTLALADDNLAVADPGDVYWQTTWDRFQDELAESEQDRSSSETMTAWHYFWKPAMQIGFVAVTLVLGVFIGKQFTTPDVDGYRAGSAGQGGVLSSYEEPLQQNVARERQQYVSEVTRDSLQRSNRVLNDFMRIDTGGMQSGRGGQWSVASRDELVELLDTFAHLRNFDNSIPVRQVEPLLNELELLIAEIASIGSAEEEDIRYEIQMIQQGIQRRELLERIQMVTSNEAPAVWRKP